MNRGTILLFMIGIFGWTGCTYLGYPDERTVMYDVQYYLDEKYPDIPLRVDAVQNLANSGSPTQVGSFRVRVFGPHGVKFFLYWENGSKKIISDIRSQYQAALNETALCDLLSRLIPPGIDADVFVDKKSAGRPFIEIICMNMPTEANKDYLVNGLAEALRETNSIIAESYPARVYFTWKSESRGKSTYWEIDAQEHTYYNTYLELDLNSYGIASPYYPDGPAAGKLEKDIRAQLPGVGNYSYPVFYRIQQEHLSEVFLLYKTTDEQYIAVISTLEGEKKIQQIIDIPFNVNNGKEDELNDLIPEGFRHPERGTKFTYQ